jgi:hypothetical protein
MLRICVIMATYFRKNGTSKENISRALRILESQTYSNFKLFLIGDHYDNNDEFEELCKSYTKDIFYKNNEEHYRHYTFLNKKTYWAIGGGLAIKTGVEKAMEENYDYYFHLDDDDMWSDKHIETVVNHIHQFPFADFILTKSAYCDTYLPRVNVSHTFYNNYTPCGGDSVHASHVYKLKSLGNTVLNVINDNHILANKLNNKQTNETIDPGDMTILNTIGKMVTNNEIKSLYIPITTVSKDSEANFPV